MPGTSDVENHHLFKVGEPCLISVDSVNTPTGVWWGLVLAVGEKPSEDSHKTHISVDAVITGEFKPRIGHEKYCPVTGLSKIPTSNFEVYPATRTNIKFWEKVLRLKVKYQILETNRKIEMNFLREILENKK